MSLTQLRLGAGALAVAGALLIAAPTSGAGATVATAKKGTSITISNFMFTPMSIKVKPGTKIKVTNKDSVTHTLSRAGKGHVQHRQHRPQPVQDHHRPEQGGYLPLHLQHPSVHDGNHHGDLIGPL